MEMLKDLRSEGATIYQLNDKGTNNWSALVQPAPKSVAWPEHEVVGSAIASDLAVLPNITKQLLRDLVMIKMNLGKMSEQEAIDVVMSNYPDLLRLNHLQELL
jgi:hypothetical protein